MKISKKHLWSLVDNHALYRYKAFSRSNSFGEDALYAATFNTLVEYSHCCLMTWSIDHGVLLVSKLSKVTTKLRTKEQAQLARYVIQRMACGSHLLQEHPFWRQECTSSSRGDKAPGLNSITFHVAISRQPSWQNFREDGIGCSIT